VFFFSALMNFIYRGLRGADPANFVSVYSLKNEQIWSSILQM